jgi:selenide,water dikinase
VRGGATKLQEAGCVLLGGHSVRDPEIKFGYAVTGVVDPGEVFTNAQARAGDVVVLTKPIGTGVIATALKAGVAPEDAVEASTRSMATLNRIPATVARRHGVRAATDVTGFGLVGHALNVARESGVTLEIESATIPTLPGALDLALTFQAAGLKANRRQYESSVEVGAALEPALEALLYDPQTSGGLLLLVPEANVQALLADLPNSRRIGCARPASDKPIRLV